MTNTASTKTSTYAQRFAAKEWELRDIAVSLGREDIFDRDLNNGEIFTNGQFVRLPARSDEAIRTAVSGIGWYLQEDHEWDGEAGYAQDPRTAKYHAIVKFLGR